MTVPVLPGQRHPIAGSLQCTPEFYRALSQLVEHVRGQGSGSDGGDVASLEDRVTRLGVQLAGLTTDQVAEGSRLYFTDARVYAAAKAILQQGSNVTITPDDGAQTLTIAASGGGGSSWQKSFDIIPNLFTSNWNGLCLRMVLASKAFFPRGATKLQLYISGGTSTGTVDAMYVGKMKNNASGQPIEFNGTPVQVKVAGATTFTVPANDLLISDDVALTLAARDSIVIAADVHFSNGPSYSGSSPFGTSTYYKTGSDASNPSTSSYSTSSYKMNLVLRIDYQ